MTKLREPYRSRIISIITLSIALCAVVVSSYKEAGSAVKRDDEAAVRDALMKSASTFEKNDESLTASH